PLPLPLRRTAALVRCPLPFRCTMAERWPLAAWRAPFALPFNLFREVETLFRLTTSLPRLVLEPLRFPLRLRSRVAGFPMGWRHVLAEVELLIITKTTHYWRYLGSRLNEWSKPPVFG